MSRKSRMMLRVAAATGALLIVLHGCASTKAKFPTQHYVPLSTEAQPWGTLELDDKHARFDSLEGEMQLEYAGRLPEVEGSDFSSASVYRVKNGEKFLKVNAGGSRLCAEPPRWLAVASTSGAPAWSGEIWLALLTLDDWRKFDDAQTNSCARGKYVVVSNGQF